MYVVLPDRPCFCCRSEKANKLQYLAYQFAGLAQHVYTRIGNSMGITYDTTKEAQELRRNVWLAPVLSRLQRSCVLFSAAEAEEQIEEQRTAGFDKLLKRMRFHISPEYTLATDRSAPRDFSGALPAWNLAHFVQKVLRNSVLGVDLQVLEEKVTPVLRESIAERMKAVIRPLEQVTLSGHGASTAKEMKVVDQLVNVAHDSVAAVLVLWQVRYNIVGVPTPAVQLSGTSGDAEVMRVKDYLRPVVLRSVVDGAPVKASALLESVPSAMRHDVSFEVEELARRLQPSPGLYNVALLAEAVRGTASEEFRALSTYNVDADQIPAVSRDDMYSFVLSAVLVHFLRGASGGEDLLYEHLLAFAALEESWGVREPRAAASKALQTALVEVATSSQLDKPSAADSGEELGERIVLVEKALGMLLRLPEGDGNRCRAVALEKVLDHLLPGKSTDVEQNGRTTLTDAVEAATRTAVLLGVTSTIAEDLLRPRKLAIFDRSVKDLLLNADVATSMPALVELFAMQVRASAQAVGMSAAEATARAAHLAAATLASFLLTAHSDGAKLAGAKVDAVLTKGMYIAEHPFWRQQEQELSITQTSVLKEAVQMVVAKLGRSATPELMRSLDRVRARFAAAAGAVGAHEVIGTGKPDHIHFVGFLK
jgi:hypothetical protein